MFLLHERFGREDNTLVMVSNTGTINVRILKRTAQFECLEVSSAPQIGRFLDSKQFYNFNTIFSAAKEDSMIKLFMKILNSNELFYSLCYYCR